MKAKDFAKELYEIHNPEEILKTHVAKCLEIQNDILTNRYKRVLSHKNFKSSFDEVDIWQKSVVRHLIKLDDKYSDFSTFWKIAVNRRLEEKQMEFRV